MSDKKDNVFPDSLMIRDTQIYDDMGGLGQRIYTTAGAGYEKVRYVRADLTSDNAALKARIAKLEALVVDAPCDFDCDSVPRSVVRFGKLILESGACDCWKSKALEEGG